MAGFTIDIANALVNLWGVWKKDKEFQAWLRLVLSTVYSGVIAMLVATGGALTSGTRTSVAVGIGLTAAGLAIFGVLLKQPEGRSLLLSLPTSVVEQYQDQVAKGTSTIEPAVKK